MCADLEKYLQKRDFARTPEPRGRGRKIAEKQLRFVVQKHDATRLHYDLRLEHDGVLKSWAVPKEPTLEPKQRRLAVQVEDHPLEYGSFEGEIPKNQYGAGSVVIWDQGFWTPEGDPERGLTEGKLDFVLDGERLHGRWTLVRLEKRDREKQISWLLIKRSDRGRAATADDDRRVAKGAGSAELNPGKVPGARRGRLPDRIEPHLATLVEQAPAGSEWLHEPKLDGYRLLCRIESRQVTLLTRRGNDWTDRFPTVVEQASALPCKYALLDGEAVVFDTEGLSDFQQLQSAIRARDAKIVFVAFDLLHLDGWDLRDSPLHARKSLLQDLLDSADGTIQYSEHIVGRGQVFYQQACKLGFEGTIAKRASDPYREERSQSWLKIKCMKRQEFVIIGYTDPTGSRVGFGALLLGVRDLPGGPLRYAGKVGTGFDAQSLRSLHCRLAELERRTAPVAGPTPGTERNVVHWVTPELVAEVSFSEWTDDGLLRHSSFRGLREDKPAEEIVKELPNRAIEKSQSAKRVKISSGDKVLYPEDGITKRHLADYWESIAKIALPYISNRPLTLLRCPEGYTGTCFYQKHPGLGAPKAIARVTVDEDGDPYMMVDGVQALIGLAQMEALEVHVWGSRADHLEQPDIIVFDLDPSDELPWAAVAEAAFDVKSRVEELGLAAFVRLSGGKGLHVVVPVVPGPDWRAIKQFTRAFAQGLVRAEPQRYTASMSKSRRTGKIFVDYLRNRRGSTAIASYSPRAKPGAPIALPIEWSELEGTSEVHPQYGMLEVPELLNSRMSDPWQDFESSRRSLTD